MQALGRVRHKLIEARESKGTQRKVAADLEITETHLRELEKGRSIPGTKLLKRMEYYFGIPDDDLFPDLLDPAFFSSD
ncbi:multiprotein-bridging factor 1 family protein [Cohnella suwonensis]|uniref:Multiprotein-bridging factor 1 family protein n=1 Tax=Cohnella suwonensis TaxID=696072 RepID=A0ABW0LU03_9BACL